MYIMLHVGAINISGRACLFAAPSFGGKSTLTHTFLNKGHALLSDDKLALYKEKNQYRVAPSYPYARAYRALEDLGKYIDNFNSKSLPVDIMYKLTKTEENHTIDFSILQGLEKYAVVEMSYEIKMHDFKIGRYEHINDMVKYLTVYEVTVPQNLDRLDEVYQKICIHFIHIIDIAC